MLYVYLLDILGSTYTFIHAINKSKSIFLNNEKSMKTLFTISIFDILYKSNKVILVFFILVLINLTGKYYNNTGLHHVFCFSRRTHFSPHKSLPCKESSDFQNYNAISFLFALNYGQIGMGWVGAYKVELYWYASAVFQHSISPTNSIRLAESHNEVFLLSNNAKVKGQASIELLRCIKCFF